MNLRTAFTLIELLVVISIMAVLASILMPAISSVRAQSQSTACGSNQRQCGLALLAYANDWDGNIYYRMQWGLGNSTQWPQALINADLTDNKAVYACPAWAPRKYATSPGTSQFNGYGFRWRTAPVNAGLQIYPFTDALHYECIFKITKVPKAASYALITDTIGTDISKPNTYGLQFIEWYLNGSASEGLVHFRHLKLAQVFYADGHGGSFTREVYRQLILDEYANPALALWCATADGQAQNLN